VELENAYPSLQGKVHLLPPGVRFPELTSISEKAALRHELEIASDVFLLLFVANDYMKKGIIPLLGAIQKLPKNMILCVVGNSIHIPQYSKIAEQMGVAQQVRFIGSVSSVDSYYRCADALVHPTTEDTFSMVTLEALAHGLPVIVSGSVYCGISAHLTDEDQALILRDPRDVDEIANSVMRLSVDDALRLRLGRNGRNFAEKYSWKDLARRQEEIYELALN
jgi:UDP-glucose:(heptosyl)LPS alpha-1,3-glucosyltransferase